MTDEEYWATVVRLEPLFYRFALDKPYSKYCDVDDCVGRAVERLCNWRRRGLFNVKGRVEDETSLRAFGYLFTKTELWNAFNRFRRRPFASLDARLTDDGFARSKVLADVRRRVEFRCDADSKTARLLYALRAAWRASNERTRTVLRAVFVDDESPADVSRRLGYEETYASSRIREFARLAIAAQTDGEEGVKKLVELLRRAELERKKRSYERLRELRRSDSTDETDWAERERRDRRRERDRIRYAQMKTKDFEAYSRLAERRKEYYRKINADPEALAKKREWRRAYYERRKADPAFVALNRARAAEQRERAKNDPALAARRKAYQRAWLERKKEKERKLCQEVQD